MRRDRWVRTVCGAAAVFAGAFVQLIGVPAPAWAATSTGYSVVPLTAPDLVCVMGIRAINASGEIAGWGIFSDGESPGRSVAFVWSGGTFTQLPDPPYTSAAQNCSSNPLTVPYGIDSKGEVDGSGVDPVSTDASRTLFWSSPTATPVSIDANCRPPGYLGDVAGMNAAGDMTGVYVPVAGPGCQNFGTGEPYVLPAGATTPRVVFNTNDPVCATVHGAAGVAINGNDQVVAQEGAGCGAPVHCVLVSASGAAKELFSPSCATTTNSLNNAGVYIASFGHTAGYSVNGGPQQTLPALSGQPQESLLGINNRGDVTGWSATGSTPGTTATLWAGAVPPATGTPPPPVDLNTLIPADASIDLTSAVAINDSGEIVAQGTPTLGGPAEYVLLECPGVPAAASDRRFGASVEKASAAGGGCPLDVAVTGRLTLSSGLAHRSFRNPDLARFFSGASETSSEACQSGCTDLTVTVTDPSDRNKPVSGAEVDASVQPITAGLAPYPAGAHPGDGYLCFGSAAASAAACGNGSHEVTGHTDDNGQIKLRYWAPGVLKPEHVLLTVKAKLPCGETSCPAGLKQGELTPNPTLTVEPNVVIGTLKEAKVGELEPADARDLADWTKDSSLKRLEEFIANHTKEQVLSTAIKVALEKEAEGPIAIAALIKELTAVNKEEIGFMSVLLNKLNVRLRGLGIETPNVVHQPGPLPGDPFLREVAADDGPFTIDDGGLTWQYGKELAKLPRIKTQTLHLRVYEVSYCQQGEECGPGYSGVLEHRYDGIHPYLYFDFHADRAPLVHEGEPNTVQGVYSKSFIVPYNAEAWMRAQFGG